MDKNGRIDGIDVTLVTNAFKGLPGTEPPPLVISTASLANGQQGVAYSAPITASGGTGQGYVWSQSAGTLPPGLILSASGNPTATLSGTPTTVGSYGFTIQVRDAAGYTGSKPFTITIAPSGGGGGEQ
ncbi:MAG: putative Ig domain-containing protein [Planctomycetes bacterium]|nr:putative Ig domain-containing protein [Planctomycetota bacterium]